MPPATPGRPGRVTGARIETNYVSVSPAIFARRPGRVTGARIETTRRGNGRRDGRVAPVA